MVRSRLFKLLQNKGKKLMPLSVYVAVVLLVFSLFIPVINKEIKERTKQSKSHTTNTVSVVKNDKSAKGSAALSTDKVIKDKVATTEVVATETEKKLPQNGEASENEKSSVNNSSLVDNSSLVNEGSLENVKPLAKDPPVVKNVQIGEIIWPLKGEVIREYGLSYSKTFSDYRYHNGIDISAARGAEVVLVLPGKVSKKESTKGEETKITIEHGQGWVSVYEHLEATVLKEGEYYQAGEIVGTVNQPGLNEVMEGPHLHYTLYKDNKLVNPLDYLQ